MTYLADSRNVLFFYIYQSGLKLMYVIQDFRLCDAFCFGFFLRSYQGRIVRSDKQQSQIGQNKMHLWIFFFSVSNHSRIVDQATGTELASFPIYKVLFCARGHEGSDESDCFSFTESYRSSEDFQIHVFSCHIKEAVSSVMFNVQRVCLEM